MDGEYQTIKLKHTIPYKGKNGEELRLGEIKIGRLKAKHLKLLPESLYKNTRGRNNNNKKNNDLFFNPSDILPLIAGISELPEESIGELDIDDLILLAEKIFALLGE